MLYQKRVHHLDVLWALRPRHVTVLLQHVLDYWADYWRVPRTEIVTVYTPLDTEAGGAGDSPRASQLTMDARCRRTRSLKSVSRPSVGIGIDAGSSALPQTSNRRLYAAILHQAATAYADHCVSAEPGAQRQALGAYWWIMSLPVASPLHIQMTPVKWAVVYEGRYRDMRIPAAIEDPLPLLGMRLDDLWEFRDHDPEIPLGTETSTVSFLECCRRVDIDPDAFRRRVHLLPPST